MYCAVACGRRGVMESRRENTCVASTSALSTVAAAGLFPFHHLFDQHHHHGGGCHNTTTNNTTAEEDTNNTHRQHHTTTPSPPHHRHHSGGHNNTNKTTPSTPPPHFTTTPHQHHTTPTPQQRTPTPPHHTTTPPHPIPKHAVLRPDGRPACPRPAAAPRQTSPCLWLRQHRVRGQDRGVELYVPLPRGCATTRASRLTRTPPPPAGRHGDIEDTLLTLLMSRAAGGQPFDKMSVARVYFGNWLRDYCECGPRATPDGVRSPLTRRQPRPSTSARSSTCRPRPSASSSGS